MIDDSFRKERRKERWRGAVEWIRDEARGIAVIVAVALMLLGLVYVLGIKDPIFSDDEMNEPAPR